MHHVCHQLTMFRVIVTRSCAGVVPPIGTRLRLCSIDRSMHCLIDEYLDSITVLVRESSTSNAHRHKDRTDDTACARRMLNLRIQEFMIVPAAGRSFKENLRIITCTINCKLKERYI